MKQPDFLKEGDQAAIVSPAGKLEKKFLDNAKRHFNEWGIEVVAGKNAAKSYHQFAGEDNQRAEDLQKALNDPDIKAIFCSRGGYGSARIINKLDFSEFVKHPKWLVGFSDITVFHNYINNKLKIASLHAVMPVKFPEFPKTDAAIESVRKFLSGGKYQISMSTNIKNKTGKAKGIITGGNLSLLYSLRGTTHDFDYKDKILFIEEVDEYMYHIDRMMNNLYMGDKFRNIRGLIVGKFSKIKDNKTSFGKSVSEIILDYVKDFNFPVCFDFPAGHVKKNMALPFGCEAELIVEKNSCSLKF